VDLRNVFEDEPAELVTLSDVGARIKNDSHVSSLSSWWMEVLLTRRNLILFLRSSFYMLGL
jgi:hypothetical protein